MSPQNVAAWIRAPKADLEIDEAPFNEPGPGEILIKVSRSIPMIHILLRGMHVRMKPLQFNRWMPAYGRQHICPSPIRLSLAAMSLARSRLLATALKTSK